MQPGDPPILSPDGRYAFAHGEIERRNNEWLPFAYIEDARRGVRLVALGTSLQASIEWTGPASFTLTVRHDHADDLAIEVHGDAAAKRFELADGSRRGPLKDLPRVLDQWFESRIPPPPRKTVRIEAAVPSPRQPSQTGGSGALILLAGVTALAALALALLSA